MESKQLRLIFLLTFTLIGMFALIRFWEPTEESDDPAATEPLWDLEREDVNVFAIDREHGRLVFERESENDWRMTEPSDGAADDRAVDALLWDLVRNEFGVPIPDGTEDAFGFAPPRATITLTDKDGTDHVLKIGMDAPVGYRTYVIGPAGTILAVDGQFGKKLLEDAAVYQDKSVFDYDVADVVAASIDGPQGFLEVRKIAEDWWLTDYAHANLDRVDDLLVGLLNLRFTTLMPAPPEGHILEPMFTIQIETADGEVHTVQVGDHTPMGVLVLRVGDTGGMVPPDELMLLGQGPPDLGESHAFPVKPHKLERVNVDLGGKVWSLDLGEGGWLRDGEPEPRADHALTAMASASVHMRSSPIPPITEVWGTVTLSEPVLSRTIEIGQREGGSWRVAKDRAGGNPYLVPVSDLEALAGAMEIPLEELDEPLPQLP